MASSWSALKDSYAESTKDTVKFQSSSAPSRFLLYETRLIKVRRLQRTGKNHGLVEADQLWVKFVGFSRRLQKRFRRSFHTWLSCWLAGEILSDFGKIVEAVTGERPKGYMTEEAARIFAQQLTEAIHANELYAKILFRKFKPGDRYVAGTEIESVKLIDDDSHPEFLTKAVCDTDKDLLWNIHPQLYVQQEYLVFRNDNSVREFGHCLPEFEESKESSELEDDCGDDQEPFVPEGGDGNA